MPKFSYAKKAADIIGILLFLSAFTGFIVQIFFRYVLNQPLAWSEEATMIAFIWTVFWAAAFMVPIKEHVTFDVVYDIVSQQVQRVMSIFTMSLLVIAFAILLPYTFDYLDFLFRKKTPVLRIQMVWVYCCYALFIGAFTLQAGWRLYHLCSAKWRAHL